MNQCEMYSHLKLKDSREKNAVILIRILQQNKQYRVAVLLTRWFEIYGSMEKPFIIF